MVNDGAQGLVTGARREMPGHPGTERRILKGPSLWGCPSKMTTSQHRRSPAFLLGRVTPSLVPLVFLAL